MRSDDGYSCGSGTAAAVLYGLSVIGMSTFVMIRMYMLLTLLTVVLMYLIACLMEKKYFGAVLCILAEACIVWTLYGAGVCLLITAAWVVLRKLLPLLENKLAARREKTKMNRSRGEGDTE